MLVDHRARGCRVPVTMSSSRVTTYYRYLGHLLSTGNERQLRLEYDHQSWVSVPIIRAGGHNGFYRIVLSANLYV